MREESEKKAAELLRTIKASADRVKASERWWQRDAVLRRARFHGEYAADDFDSSGQQRRLAVEQTEQVTHARWMTELSKTPATLLPEYAPDAIAANNPALAYRVWNEAHERQYSHNSERARTVTAVGNVLATLALPEVEQAQARLEEADGLMERAKNRYAEVFRGVHSSMNKIS